MPLIPIDEDLPMAEHDYLCHHEQVCIRCGRKRCTFNLTHSIIRGWVCVCGSKHWEAQDEQRDE